MAFKPSKENEEYVSTLFHSRFKKNPFNPWDKKNKDDRRMKAILNKPGGLSCSVKDKTINRGVSDDAVSDEAASDQPVAEDIIGDE